MCCSVRRGESLLPTNMLALKWLTKRPAFYIAESSTKDYRDDLENRDESLDEIIVQPNRCPPNH